MSTPSNPPSSHMAAPSPSPSPSTAASDTEPPVRKILKPLLRDQDLPLENAPAAVSSAQLFVLDSTTFDPKTLHQLDLAAVVGARDPGGMPDLAVLTQPDTEQAALRVAHAAGYCDGLTRYILSRVQQNGACRYRNCGGIISNEVQAKLLCKTGADDLPVKPALVNRTPIQGLVGNTLGVLLDQLVCDTPTATRVLVTGSKDRETKRIAGFYRLKVTMPPSTADAGPPAALCGSLFEPRLAAPSSFSPQRRLVPLINTRSLDKLVQMKQTMVKFCELPEDKKKAVFTDGTDFSDDDALRELKNCEWLQCLPPAVDAQGPDAVKFLKTDVIKQVSAAISKRRKMQAQKNGKAGKRKSGAGGGARKARKPAGITAPQKLSSEFCLFLEENLQAEMQALNIDPSGLRVTGIPRATGVSLMMKYVKNKQLGLPKRKIKADAALSKLLFQPSTPQDTMDELGYFTLPGLMNRHYIPNPKPTPAPAPVPTPA